MTTFKQEYDELLQTLETQRDEIKLQIHLAKAELREEWLEIEKKWEHFKSRSERVLKEADSTASDVGDTFQLLGEELKEGYKRIKKLL